MTKRYKTLQKKLRELEAELTLIFSLPPDTTTPYHHLLSDGIDHRFLFLKNLLSAEIASQPSNPRHLRHVSQRLTELEIAFRQWDDYRTSSSSLVANDVTNEFDSAVAAANDGDDSVCSCDESCRNDGGEELVEENINLPMAADGKLEEGKEKLGINNIEVEKEKVIGRSSMLGRNWAVWISGVVSGTILTAGAAAMIEYYGFSDSTLHEGFLIPT